MHSTYIATVTPFHGDPCDWPQSQVICQLRGGGDLYYTAESDVTLATSTGPHPPLHM